MVIPILKNERGLRGDRHPHLNSSTIVYSEKENIYPRSINCRKLKPTLFVKKETLVSLLHETDYPKKQSKSPA